MYSHLEPGMTLEEYISLCARLHNQLLAKSIPSSKTIADGWNPSPENHPNAMLYQPAPELFYPELFFSAEISMPLFTKERQGTHPLECSRILLYPQRIHDGMEPAMDGGIFVNVDTMRAVWHSGGPDSGAGMFPRVREWAGLDVILRKELSKWTDGRYTLNNQGGIGGVKWVPYRSSEEGRNEEMNDVSGIGVADDIRKAQEAEVGAGTESQSRDTIDRIVDATGGDFPKMQVFESIQQWDHLLTAIEKRMGSAGNKPTGERLPPISPEIADTIKICQFARDFLTRARRPATWSFLGPGIRTFTDETIREIYSDESPNTRRLSVIFEGGDYVSLLLPGEKVPLDDGGSGSPGIAKEFDKVWGWSHMAVDRRAGLYITFPGEWDGDLVQLVAPSGNTMVGMLRGRCPWGPDRQPRLAEILGHWAGLAEKEVWKVNGNGVAEGGDWFEKNTNLGNMDWKY
ncbi:hypothetical protein V8F06_004866 [Rhypophila decipiens]